MKVIWPLLLSILISPASAANSSISGKVEIPNGCGDKAMVWLSLDKDEYKERLLLMHTEVPKGGTFQFYVLPGDYQIRASDSKGCEFFKRVSVKSQDSSIDVKLEKK